MQTEYTLKLKMAITPVQLQAGVQKLRDIDAFEAFQSLTLDQAPCVCNFEVWKCSYENLSPEEVQDIVRKNTDFKWAMNSVIVRSGVSLSLYLFELLRFVKCGDFTF